MTASADLSQWPLTELRSARSRARRAAEFARLRSRQGTGPVPGAAEEAVDLEAQVDRLTDELVSRYAADLGLVDSLLDEPYPAKGRGRG